MSQTKEKPKKAVREIPVNLEIELSSYGNEITVKVGNNDVDDDSYEHFTEKQLHNIAEQIVEKFNTVKVTLLNAVNCPNCKKRVDETKEKDVYHCPECNLTIRMEFKK